MAIAAWRQEYRKRIKALLEACRECGLVSADLTFDHIWPKSKGGYLSLSNTTILCRTCQHRKGNNIWPHQVSLAVEQLNTELALRIVDVSPAEAVYPVPLPPRKKTPKARNRAPKFCPPDCGCSSCTFWRAALGG